MDLWGAGGNFSHFRNFTEGKNSHFRNFTEGRIMYECFHCGHRSVIWDADFNTEDYGYDRPGIVHDCHCCNCGAII